MSDHTPSEADFDPVDPIVAAWADQTEIDGFPDLASDPAALTDALENAHRKDQRTLLWLNVREVGPSLVVAGVFGGLAPYSDHLAASLAATILILAVALFLVSSSIRHYRADRRWGASVRDQLARRLAQLNHRAWMYRNVAWWYFLPIFLAVGLAYYGYGGEFGSPQGLVIFGLYFGFCVVMYRINRKLGRSRYESEIARLEPLLAEFNRTV